MNVLVTTICTPDDRQALATVRALAAKGARVFVAADGFRGQAGWSRHVAARFRLPDPADGAARYVDALFGVVRTAAIDVVLPTRLETTLPLSRHGDRLGGDVRFVVPPEAGLRIANDKLTTLQVASELGLRIPKTVCPANVEELREVAGGLSYPAVVKPVEAAGALGLWYARTPRELIEGWDLPRPGIPSRPSSGKTLVQERIPGGVVEACLLFRHGEPRAALSQKRLLMYPASGGAGTLDETTDDPEVIEAGTALLRRLAWHGPAQVEFKRDARTGELVLLEVNGRLWGTLDLSVQAGMNFPWLICRLALDGDIPVQDGYRRGLRFRWPLPYGVLDLVHSGRPVRALRRFFGPTRVATASNLHWDDPLPPLVEIAWVAERMWRRGSWRPVRR